MLNKHIFTFSNLYILVFFITDTYPSKGLNINGFQTEFHTEFKKKSDYILTSTSLLAAYINIVYTEKIWNRKYAYIPF